MRGSMTRYDKYVDRKLHDLHYKHGEYREDDPAIGAFFATVVLMILAIPAAEIFVILFVGKIMAVVFLTLDTVILCTKKVIVSTKETHPSTFMLLLSVFVCVGCLLQAYPWFNL